MVLPSPEAINPVIEQFPKVEWIFQINPETLQRLNTQEIHHYLEEFTRVDYLLFDQSKGQGILGDWQKMEAFLSDFPNYNIALAGGLGPNTLSSLGPLLGQTSIDAQGRLTRPGEDDYNPYLDMQQVKAYLTRASSAFQ